MVLVGGDHRYRPCRNFADGQAHFVLAPEDYARAEGEGEVMAVVHSHPNAAPEPSEADRVMMARWGLPWLILNVPVGHWRLWYPDGWCAGINRHEVANERVVHRRANHPR
ncbi:C40 family peptidase [Corallococcus interemptor]|uniref:C40 family peptidase n=1 Tax=Corallococcus interemptor TaxID=2316720 RepID=UPI0035D418F9